MPSAPGRPAGEVEPAAWAASSRTGTPSASISAIGATLPNRCTAMTALVLGVIAAFTVSAVTHIVSGSTSQKTGVAPVAGIASADAQKVNDGTMTSSPGPTPSARSATVIASVPLATPIACPAPR